MSAALFFDAMVCVLMLASALGAVVTRDLLAAVMLFVTFGLLAAVAWVRLDAVDVALAEAAIGAGLTGLLLVSLAGRLRSAGAGAPPPPAGLAVATLRAGLCAALAGVLLAVVLAQAAGGDGLRPLVAEELSRSGVRNPVTAVLLNFRGYDTLLESVVLLAALVGVWALTPAPLWGLPPGRPQHVRAGGVLSYFGRFLPVVGLLVGLRLFWAGADQPGGAFQAGVVLAAVALLAALAGQLSPPSVVSPALRAGLVIGPAAFLGLGAAGAATGVFMGWPEGWAKPAILAIEALLTLSIAATLALLVLGPPQRPGADR